MEVSWNITLLAGQNFALYLMRVTGKWAESSDQETIQSICRLYLFTVLIFSCLLHCSWAHCGESVSENRIVKGKLKWKEPFKKETVTVTCQVAYTQLSWCKRTGIPLDGQHAIRSPWGVNRRMKTVGAVSGPMNSTERRGRRWALSEGWNLQCGVSKNLITYGVFCDILYLHKLKAESHGKRHKTILNTNYSRCPIYKQAWNNACNISFFEKDTPLQSKTPDYDLRSSQVQVTLDLKSTRKQIMSRVEALKDTNLRSLLRELRTDIAMAVDDPFPLVYGLADKNIITDQLLKVSKSDIVWLTIRRCICRNILLHSNLLFYRILWRRRTEKGSTRPCILSCPGSWSRADPLSRLSGATCPKTTTWTATPSCRHCSLTYTQVYKDQVWPKYCV